jgi:hypothetical protein
MEIRMTSMLTGVMVLKPPEYRVAALPPVIPPWWAFWRQPQEQWEVRTELMTLGPFDTQQAADDAAALCIRATQGRR